MGRLAPTSLANHYTGQTGIHSDGSNFLLGDGHAKWMRGPAVSPGHTGTAGQYQNQTAGQAAATDKLYLNNGTSAAAATFSPI